LKPLAAGGKHQLYLKTRAQKQLLSLLMCTKPEQF